MEISVTTQEDGKAAAAVLELLQLVSKLIDALRLAGLPISGPGINNKDQASRWMAHVAQKMAVDLSQQSKQKADNKPMSVASISAPQKLTSGSKSGSKSKKK